MVANRLNEILKADEYEWERMWKDRSFPNMGFYVAVRMDHAKPVRIDDLAQIRRRDLPNTKQWCYPLDHEDRFLDPALTRTLMCPESKGTF
jgi:hypothetical protein